MKKRIRCRLGIHEDILIKSRCTQLSVSTFGFYQGTRTGQIRLWQCKHCNKYSADLTDGSDVKSISASFAAKLMNIEIE